MTEIPYASRELSRLHYLFDNDHPDQVWSNANEILTEISSKAVIDQLSLVFHDVVNLFYGDYPGYQMVKTPYHDLRHTMDVFMCALRLMHGMQQSGEQLNDEEIFVVAVSALMHDIGYAKHIEEDSGSGAQFTKTHVSRGIDFMHAYFRRKHYPTTWAVSVERAILCTNPALKLSDIEFSSPREQLIGRLVGTADLVGQMADRSYLEKLMFLYFEFREANMGNFESVNDMLLRTREFYGMSRMKLNLDYGSVYQYLECHFKKWFGVKFDYYIDSIDKNITYLSKIIANENGIDFFSNLKRRGIVEKARKLEEEFQFEYA